ncbi:hypothetical protein BDQ17DRAFT_1390074 [Cyathus striatus]|nr:hypothetical protein BDQ17DRAFT_1390074 [Cyathus striatus]
MSFIGVLPGALHYIASGLRNVDYQHAGTVPNIHPQSSHPHAVKIPDGLYTNAGISQPSSFLAPQKTYNGDYDDAKDIRLRIANGGAGQSGLIGAWANAFIKYCVEKKGEKPFLVGWYLGDTTESLGLLAAGSVDIAVTYNEAAEKQSLDTQSATKKIYGFRDHFLLVGPKANPAQLENEDDILTMFNKIVTMGNADLVVPPGDREPTRFLSRYDKSATNIKESELFVKIGQVPWGLVYSKWYHQYPRFPLQALRAASVLSEYTLTDRGTWLSSEKSVTDGLEIYKAGLDEVQDDPLLNPAHVLLGSKAESANEDIWTAFMDWVVRKDGGQKVIREFKTGNGEVLYSEAPAA